MSKILEIKNYQKFERKEVRFGLDSAQSGQLNTEEWYLKTLFMFVDIWKLWQKKCLLMQRTQRKLALWLLKEIKSRSLTFSLKTDANLQEIFI